MADNKDQKFPSKRSEKGGEEKLDDTIPPYSSFGKADEDFEQEGLSSTMMSIDPNQFGLDVTKTAIRKEEASRPPSDQEIIEERLEKKRHPFIQSLHRIFKRKKGSGQPFQLPQAVKGYLGIWICYPAESFFVQTFFYLIRFFIIGVALSCQYLFLKGIIDSVQNQHPAMYFFLGAFFIQFAGIVFCVWKKFSPAWVFSLPVSAISLIMSYGTLFYHTADPNYFSLFGTPISETFNGFYLLILIFSFVLSVFYIVRNFALKIFVSGIFAFAILSFGYNFLFDIRLEASLFGIGFFKIIPYDVLQPATLTLFIIFPLFLLLFGIFSFVFRIATQARGFSRSLAFLFLFISFLNISLMQKNRVSHFFNLFLPQRLDVGGIEMNHQNQDFKIVTKNFFGNQGSDRVSRYKMEMTYSNKKKKFLLQVVDQFDFPVYNLTKHDLLVSSNGKNSEHFSLKEEKSFDPKKASYWLEMKLEPQDHFLKWPSKRGVYQKNDFLALSLSDPKKLKRLEVKFGDQMILDVSSPLPEKIDIPLYYFHEGEVDLTAFAYDDLGQEIFQEKMNFSVKNPENFSLLFPLEEDLVGEQVNVLFHEESLPKNNIQKVKYFWNGNLLEESVEFSYFHTLDLREQPLGKAILEIEIVTEKESFKKKISLNRVSEKPNFLITEPAFGVFAKEEMTVSYELMDPSKKVAGIKVFVNGIPFENFKSEKQSFVLPISRWQYSQIYLSVQATLQDGEKLSAWTQINRGTSELELKFDSNSLGFLNFGKTAFIFDASVSNWDNWQNQSKWKTMTEVVLAPEVETKIADLNPEFFAFGSEKPYYFYDCSDARDLLVRQRTDQPLAEKKEYNKALLKRILEGLQPGGTGALFSAIQLAYKVKPELLVVFADSSDSCQTNLVSALPSVLKTSPQTKIFFISLGPVREKEKQEFLRLSEMTGGRYIQPENYEALIKSLLEILSLNYELYSQDKLLEKAPLGDRVFHLGPGEYTLKIPYGAGFQEIPLKLEHGTKTILSVSGKKEQAKDKIYIEQEVK